MRYVCIVQEREKEKEVAHTLTIIRPHGVPAAVYKNLVKQELKIKWIY